MNDRIIELARQAGEATCNRYVAPTRSKVAGQIWESGHVSWNELFNNEFAELIIAECCRHLTQIGEHSSSRALAEHFGPKKED